MSHLARLRLESTIRTFYLLDLLYIALLTENLLQLLILAPKQ